MLRFTSAIFTTSITLGVVFLGLLLVGPLSSLVMAQEKPLLLIFHTGDVRGQAMNESGSESGSAAQSTSLQIGYPHLASYINSFPGENKLLLDSGNFLSGSPLANVTRGEATASVIASIPYDALTPGSQDFDFGLARLMELQEANALPLISANITEREDGGFLLPPYIVKEFGDFKVGILGLTTLETPEETTPANVAALDFGGPGDLFATAQKTVDQLKNVEGVDLVIALSNLGSNGEDRVNTRVLAREVQGIDLIVDSHAEPSLNGLKLDNSTLVSAGLHLDSLGHVAVYYDKSSGFSYQIKTVPASELSQVEIDDDVAEEIQDQKELMAAKLSQVVTEIPFELNGNQEALRESSTNFGRILGAAMVAATGADIALYEGRAIHSSIAAGVVTQGQLLAALPYENSKVSLISVTGRELLAIINHGLSKSGSEFFPQFYGLKITAYEKQKRDADGSFWNFDEVEELEIGGQELNLRERYKLASTEFLVAGGGGYPHLGEVEAKKYAPLAEILAQYLLETPLEILDAISEDEVLAIIVEK